MKVELHTLWNSVSSLRNSVLFVLNHTQFHKETTKNHKHHPWKIHNLKFKIQILFLLFFFFSSSVFPQAQTTLRTIDNDAFQSGEYLKYRVYYDSWLTSWITAGYGTMTVSETDKKFQGREVYHVEVTGKSTKFFNLFMKVDDRFESYLDKEALLPWMFIRRTHEGHYVKNDDVVFNYQDMTLKSSQIERSFQEGLQDMVSAFYYMRTFDFDTAQEGDEYYVSFYLDDSIYRSRVIFMGRENVKTELGTFPCFKLKPQVATGEVFTEQYPMELWVTDDKNKIPVMGKSGVYVGSITIELVEYSGLLNHNRPITN